MTESNVVALSRYRADVARALARRGRELLAAPDPGEAMAGLEPLEAYFVVKELGVDEAMPLVVHATPEQVQTFIDLDCWEGDRPSATEMDAWLAPFAAEGPEMLAEVFGRLEPELQSAFIADSLIVYDPRADEIPEALPSVTRVRTPDSHFVVEPKPGEREVDPLVLVDALYRRSTDEAFRVLTAAKWEHGSESEETAYRFRAARLADLGFPPIEEAAGIFAPPPAAPPATAAPPPPVTLPALYAKPLADDVLVTRALARIADAALVERLERELVFLVNAAVVAYGESPREVAHAAEVASRVRDTVSLGLEVLLARDDEDVDPASETAAAAAAGLLARWPLRDLFRHGHAAVVPLARAAQALAADPVVAAWLDRPTPEGEEYGEDRRDRAFLRALASLRPLAAGFDPFAPERRRAFATRGELTQAEARLDGIARRVL